MKRIFQILFLTMLAGSLVSCGTSTTKDNDPWGEIDPGQVEVQSAAFNGTLHSNAMNRDMTFSVWLPGGYDKKKTYPFLYLLHGYEDSNQNATWNRCWLDKGNAAKIADDYQKSGGVPMVIIMPNGLDKFYYKNGYEKFFEEELMPTLEAEYKCNGKRAIAGLSMGGFGTLYHAAKYPGKFKYAYAMSPAANYVDMDYATWTIREAIYTIDVIKANPEGTVFPSFTIEVGKQDMTVSNSDSKKLSDQMASMRISCEYVERDGSHDWPFWQGCLPKALIKIGNSFK